MTVVEVLLDPILPVYAIMGLGVFLGWRQRISVEDARVINGFAISVLVPILVFGLMARAPIRDFIPGAVALYFAMQCFVFGIGFTLARRLFARGTAESILLGWGAIFANNVYFGLPITLLLYGQDAVLPITSIVILDSLVTMGGTMIALQAIGGAGQGGALSVIGGILKLPMIQALAAGLLWNAAGVPLPGTIVTFVDFAGAGAAPVALFALGVVMSRTSFTRERAVGVFVALKVLAFPLLVWLSMTLAFPQSEARPLYILAAAGPTGVSVLNIALHFRAPTATIAQVIVWTSALSLFTLAVLA